MILSELHEYLKTHQRAALMDMAHRFDTDPEAIRGMLDKWVSKGRVKKLPNVACDSGCNKCDASHIEVYEWIDPQRQGSA